MDRDALLPARVRDRAGGDALFRLGQGPLAPVPRRYLRHHHARRGVQLLAARHLPRASGQHGAHTRREIPHPAAARGGRRRRARLLPVARAVALPVRVRDLPHDLPRPDLSDQGREAPDTRLAHAALALRLSRGDPPGALARAGAERPAGEAPRSRAAGAARARGHRGDLPERPARVSDGVPDRRERAGPAHPARLPGGAVKIRVDHTTHYQYDAPVRHSAQYLRLVPAGSARQRVLEWRLETPGTPLETRDGYGNIMHLLTVERPVSEIRIRSTGVVETAAAIDEAPDELKLSPLVFLRPSRLAVADAAIVEFAEPFRRRAGTLSGLRELAAAVLARLPFQPGITNPHSTAAEAFPAANGLVPRP